MIVIECAHSLIASDLDSGGKKSKLHISQRPQKGQWMNGDYPDIWRLWMKGWTRGSRLPRWWRPPCDIRPGRTAQGCVVHPDKGHLKYKYKSCTNTNTSLTTVNTKHCTCTCASPTNTVRSKIRGQHFVTKHHHGQWAPSWARSQKCFVGFSWQMRCRIFNNQRDDFSNKFLGAAAHGVASTTWAGWLHQSPDLKSKSLNFHKLPFLHHFVVQCFFFFTIFGLGADVFHKTPPKNK